MRPFLKILPLLALSSIDLQAKTIVAHEAAAAQVEEIKCKDFSGDWTGSCRVNGAEKGIQISLAQTKCSSLSRFEVTHSWLTIAPEQSESYVFFDGTKEVSSKNPNNNTTGSTHLILNKKVGDEYTGFRFIRVNFYRFPSDVVANGIWLDNYFLDLHFESDTELFGTLHTSRLSLATEAKFKDNNYPCRLTRSTKK